MSFWVNVLRGDIIKFSQVSFLSFSSLFCEAQIKTIVIAVLPMLARAG